MQRTTDLEINVEDASTQRFTQTLSLSLGFCVATEICRKIAASLANSTRTSAICD